MTVYAYRRLSAFELTDPVLTDDADENAQIQAYCDAKNWSQLQWQTEQADNWREGFSTRITAPGAQNASRGNPKSGSKNAALHLRNANAPQLTWLPESGDSVVVVSLQRIFNSAEDAVITLDWMRAQQIGLHVVDMQADLANPDTTLNANDLLKALSAIESRRGAERMRSVKQGQRSLGRFLGGSKPFGYMVHANGKLIENPLEQRVLRQIKQLRKQGWSLRAIAEKVSTPVAPISFKTVQRVLQRED